MQKKTLVQKSTSKPSKKKGKRHQLTAEDARKGGLTNRRVRVGHILTDLQGEQLIAKAWEVAMSGDAVLLKSMIEQKYGRPVATVEAKVSANVSIELINYGDDTLQLRP